MDAEYKADEDPLLKTMRPRTVAAFRNLLNTFSGEDGGGSFQNLRLFIDELEKMAKSGDVAADECVQVMIRMSRMIDTANNAANRFREKKS